MPRFWFHLMVCSDPTSHERAELGAVTVNAGVFVEIAKFELDVSTLGGPEARCAVTRTRALFVAGAAGVQSHCDRAPESPVQVGIGI